MSRPRTEIPVEVPDLPSETTIDRAVAPLEPLRRVVRPKLYSLGGPVWLVYVGIVLAVVVVLPGYERWDRRRHPH